MMKIEQAARAEALFAKLHRILSEQGETNWIRGVSAAQSELSSHSEAGFENTKSIYRTMVEGGRGFSEYFFWNDDEEARIASNKSIDEIRDELWAIFGS